MRFVSFSALSAIIAGLTTGCAGGNAENSSSLDLAAGTFQAGVEAAGAPPEQPPDVPDPGAGGPAYTQSFNQATNLINDLNTSFNLTRTFQMPDMGMATYFGAFRATDGWNRSFGGNVRLDANFGDSTLDANFTASLPGLGTTDFGITEQFLNVNNFSSDVFENVQGTFTGGEIIGGEISGNFLGNEAQAVTGRFDLFYSDPLAPSVTQTATGQFGAVK